MLRDIECGFKNSEGISAGPGNFSVRETLCHTYVSFIFCLRDERLGSRLIGHFPIRTGLRGERTLCDFTDTPQYHRGDSSSLV